MATILIVDDLPTNREVLTTLLRHHRHEPLEAVDGRQALALARTERPDLIITDVLMPVMDGYELARQLRANDETRGIPVVFYTAHYGEPDDRALARAAGVKWILTKPADTHALMDVVDRALAGHADTGMAIDEQTPSVPATFEREHQRLLTDKLSVKTSDLSTVNARLRMLTQINLDLASERDCAQLLQRVCVAAGDLFGVADVTVGVVEPGDTATVQCVVSRGLDAPSWVAAGDAVPEPLAAVVADRQTVRDFSAVLGPAAPSFLAAPVVSPQVVYGWLCLVGPAGRLFSDEEELLVTALAGQVGRIYESIALCASAQRRGDDLQRAMAQREQAESALEVAGVGVWDMDAPTLGVRWSCMLEAQFDLAPGTFGQTFDAFVALVHPDDREGALAVIDKAMKTGEDFSFDFRPLRRDGANRWLQCTGRFQLGVGGVPMRSAGIVIDITDRRSLEAQYQQAQKMEAIGRLAGGVAHDFNNLLTAILGYCELLLTDMERGDPHINDVTSIQRAGTSAAALTRQLLAFSRKEAIEPTLLELGALVRQLHPMLSRLIGERVAVVLDLSPLPTCLTADRGQIDQVIMNLALNARDAMPAGGTLTISTARVTLDQEFARAHLTVEAGPYVALTVADTGTGMTPHVRAHLFEPFFTTKPAGEGTGLGLATVHGIVSRYGGAVGVKSGVGAGTAITVYFPRVEGTSDCGIS